MKTYPEALPADLLEQIQHAIRHAHQPGCCDLCGERVTDPRALRFPTLWCTACYHGPDDTGHCSYCRAYGVVHELTPGTYHCDQCLQLEIDSLDKSHSDESEDTLW